MPPDAPMVVVWWFEVGSLGRGVAEDLVGWVATSQRGRRRCRSVGQLVRCVEIRIEVKGEGVGVGVGEVDVQGVFLHHTCSGVERACEPAEQDGDGDDAEFDAELVQSITGAGADAGADAWMNKDVGELSGIDTRVLLLLDQTNVVFSALVVVVLASWVAWP
ncbi:hypothetical protein DHEL01_v201375 [Diaporthe helianthi]|uniref:Uncharacterized protein n=1 Tax=Diaporthe helianthi TaxID=158607 RepID=A0A2P5ICK5_DIAHE|nr:hypothetical protein DHEL01_v201375 [Diaporthe helianthi]